MSLPSKVGDFISEWYNQGILTAPPLCMYSKSLYWCLSDNSICARVGKMGFKWADRERSKIFFWAFWVSCLSWVLLAAALATVSSSPDTVKMVPFFQGEIRFSDAEGEAHNVRFYAGLKAIVVEGCEGDYCPPHSQGWDSVSCNEIFASCTQCVDASVASFSTLVGAFVTQLPQITSDLQRSTTRGDLHCQKIFGVLTGILGLLSTLSALSSFASLCYRDFDSTSADVEVTKRYGAAFYLLLVATVLKVSDIAAHLLVPAPEEDYWVPPGSGKKWRSSEREARLQKPLLRLEGDEEEGELPVL